jgi:hypothetical protein
MSAQAAATGRQKNGYIRVTVFLRALLQTVLRLCIDINVLLHVGAVCSDCIPC